MATQAIHRAFCYDHDKQKWCCYLGGPGDAIIETDTLDKMNAFIDDWEVKIAAAGADPARIDVLLRRHGHADATTKARRSGSYVQRDPR